QAKASGYSAEYRASLGGVISAITKSGGNQFHGSAGFYFTNDAMQGDVRQTLRLSPTNQTVAEYVTTPLDSYKSPEPLGDTAGPIQRDRLWFYGAYDRAWTSRSRTVTFNSTKQVATFPQQPIANVGNISVTGQITPAVRGRLTAANERDTGAYALPASGPG